MNENLIFSHFPSIALLPLFEREQVGFVNTASFNSLIRKPYTDTTHANTSYIFPTHHHRKILVLQLPNTSSQKNISNHADQIPITKNSSNPTTTYHQILTTTSNNVYHYTMYLDLSTNLHGEVFLATSLLQQPDILDGDIVAHRFAHIVHRQRGYCHRGERLHLDACFSATSYLRREFHVISFNSQLDIDERQLDIVAQRDQFGGFLRRHYPSQLGHRQYIAFFQLVFTYHLGDSRANTHFGVRGRGSSRARFRTHIHHGSLATVRDVRPRTAGATVRALKRRYSRESNS